jgi:hypothetical protein
MFLGKGVRVDEHITEISLRLNGLAGLSQKLALAYLTILDYQIITEQCATRNWQINQAG